MSSAYACVLRAQIEAEERTALAALAALSKATGREAQSAAAMACVEAHAQIGYVLMQQSLLQRHILRVVPVAHCLTRDLGHLSSPATL
jgi:hypothetical protein